MASRSHRQRRQPGRRQDLLTVATSRFPDLDNPIESIRSGRVHVNGVVVHNPMSLVRPDARIRLVPERPLRGAQKLTEALVALSVPCQGAVAVDLGACTGGFTQTLLSRGAAKVYAVEVGHGQLLGRLRQDPRVVNLERTNVADLSAQLVPEPIDLIVADVTCLPLRAVVAQVTARVTLRPGAQLVGLVKPMFELGRGELPQAPEDLASALELAKEGLEDAGWQVGGTLKSHLGGSRGAVEFFVHGRWAVPATSQKQPKVL